MCESVQKIRQADLKKELVLKERHSFKHNFMAPTRAAVNPRTLQVSITVVARQLRQGTTTHRKGIGFAQ